MNHFSLKVYLPTDLLSFLICHPLSKNILIGEVILALPSRSMSLETATLPTVDEDELRSMSQFLLDKKIPFAIDRMAYGCEILSQSEQESIALLEQPKTPLLIALLHTVQRSMK